MVNGGTVCLPMDGKMPSHSGTFFVLFFKCQNMILKPIQYSVFCLTHILYMSNITLQVLQKITALSIPMHYGIERII